MQQRDAFSCNTVTGHSTYTNCYLHRVRCGVVGLRGRVLPFCCEFVLVIPFVTCFWVQISCSWKSHKMKIMISLSQMEIWWKNDKDEWLQVICSLSLSAYWSSGCSSVCSVVLHESWHLVHQACVSAGLLWPVLAPNPVLWLASGPHTFPINSFYHVIIGETGKITYLILFQF